MHDFDIILKYKKWFCWFLHLNASLSFVGCLCSNTKKITNAEVRQKRCELFQKEKERQFNLIRRIEKIEVSYKGQPENCTLIMNKGLSTPFNCAMRKSSVCVSARISKAQSGTVVRTMFEINISPCHL
jgi:hypothetical protein